MNPLTYGFYRIRLALLCVGATLLFVIVGLIVVDRVVGPLERNLERAKELGKMEMY